MSTLSTVTTAMGSALLSLAKGARRDSVFVNETAGFTPDRDKSQAWGIRAFRLPLTDPELETLYHHHPEARAIVRKPVEHAFRRGFDLRINADEGDAGDDQDRVAAVTEALDALKAIERLRDADTWGRLYGGCLVILGADDGRAPNRPLDEKNLKRIRFLNVVDRSAVYIQQTYVDPTLPNFGEPELYRITARVTGHGGRAFAVGTVVHESRVLVFGGAPTSVQKKAQNGGWDLSVLDPVRDVLRDYEAAWRATGAMLHDKSLRVFLIQGIAGLLDSNREDGKAGVNARMKIVDRMVSVVRGLVLDSDGEDVKYIERSLVGVPEVIEKEALRLAGAADIMFTVLFGRSPAGMNATGVSDLQLWDDKVEAHQRERVQPPLERLLRLLFLSKDGPTGGREPEGWSIAWRPLRQMTEKEQAELRKIVADTDAVYITAQVVTPEQVALSRFGGEAWSMETTVDRDHLEALLEADKKYAMKVIASRPLPPGQLPPPGDGKGEGEPSDPADPTDPTDEEE